MKVFHKEHFAKKILTLLSAVALFVMCGLPVSAAQNYDGGVGVGGGGSTAVAGGTYSIGTGFSDNVYDKPILGLRFSVYNKETGTTYGSVDVYRSTCPNVSNFASRYKTTVKYNHVQLEKNWESIGLSWTTVQNFSYDSTLGVSLPETTSGIEEWQWDYDNTSAVLKHISGAPTHILNFNYGDRLLIEPIYPLGVGGSTYVLTVAEIAVLGAKTYGTGAISSSSNSNTWNFIANHTNKFFPGSLMTTSGESGLYTATSQPTSCIPFPNILTGGYGLSVVWKQDEVAKYTLTFDPNGGTLPNPGDNLYSSTNPANSVTVTYGTADYCLMVDDIPTRTGYTFGGWYATSTQQVYDANGNAVGDGTFFNSNKEWVYAANATIYAKWIPNNYTLTFDPNGGTLPNPGGNLYNSTNPANSVTVTYGYSNYSAMPNDIPTREGYTFGGWYATSTQQVYDAEGRAICEGKFFNSNKEWVYAANATIYAKWISDIDVEVPLSVTVIYDGNGATEGEGWSETFSSSENDSYTLSSDFSAFSRVETDAETGGTTLFKFMGWKIGDNAYAFGEEISSDVLLSFAKTNEDGESVVEVFAYWDEYPTINAIDRWFFLDEVLSGKVTLEELFLTADAIDGEVGDVTDFNNNEGDFTVIHFDDAEFKKFTTTGSVTVTYQAIDKVGNETYRTVTIYIVDRDKEVKQTSVVQYTRFVGAKYYKNSDGSYVAEENGGLNENSVWINVFEYEKTLTEALRNKLDVNSGKWEKIYHTWTFTKEQIAEVKAYVEEHGLGNSKESDALANFYSMYEPVR